MKLFKSSLLSDAAQIEMRLLLYDGLSPVACGSFSWAQPREKLGPRDIREGPKSSKSSNL